MHTTLHNYFPREVSALRVLYLILAIMGLWPLWRHHLRQRQDPRQRQLTAWSKTATTTEIRHGDNVDYGLDDQQGKNIAKDLHADLDLLYELLGMDPTNVNAPPSPPLPPLILCTPRLECHQCNQPLPRNALRRRVEPLSVRVLTAELQWREAQLYIAHCIMCRADYYPDSWTYTTPEGTRHQKLEYNASYLRISKYGLWAERRLAWMQEHALVRFHAGWSNFANWINDTLLQKPLLTYRQSQRLFLEHLSRRLLVAHSQDDGFSIPAHSDASTLASCVRERIGINGGAVPTSLTHGCTNCTHVKQYRSDLVAQGLAGANNADNAEQVADIDETDEALVALPAMDGPGGGAAPLLPEMPNIPVAAQEAPVGEPRGYVRLAVMDGKTITHQKCALDDCRSALVNYRNGRFCADHMHLQDVCSIIPCGQPVDPPGSLTCHLEAHRAWFTQWQSRFTRMSFPGVQRVIRRQQATPAAPGGHRPVLSVQLPPLANTPGDQVVHTFRAQTTYCLETVQWACGMPIGWGKCYKSESSPQVLDILNNIWSNGEQQHRPSFIVFDDACDLLRHIVTQNPEDAWLHTTRFIVDAWHYIGHKATDVLCLQEDLNGRIHQVRAFNTETAEQLNSWLNGFEAQMRPMTDVNYDFFVHVLLLVYGEMVEQKMRDKGTELDEEFWERAEEFL
ncbi:hypothetical protein BD310DRAFT_1026321 [Dichomitus squalens]|uniref:CxC5 like cysteine cluster associated with KDZ domain-containing protein n=1 Tax=Dichomitus squalens TaxID=114155 RepID=A0A4Q9PNV3_9APHY|nr:hypothetical protein BD310DRAFT_1026321 [Dichomitus squalens]